jgi:hypothetical protein
MEEGFPPPLLRVINLRVIIMNFMHTLSVTLTHISIIVRKREMFQDHTPLVARRFPDYLQGCETKAVIHQYMYDITEFIVHVVIKQFMTLQNYVLT